jgi:hypothetical protein
MHSPIIGLSDKVAPITHIVDLAILENIILFECYARAEGTRRDYCWTAAIAWLGRLR